MNVLVALISLVVALVAFHYLLKFSIEDEVQKQIEARSELERRHQAAVYDIRDELRRSSHRLLSTALDPRKNGQVIDYDDPDLPRR